MPEEVLTIDYSPKPVYVGTDVEIYGNYLVDTTPVAGRKVYLFINGVNIDETVTDSSGRYSFMVTFQEPGKYEVFTSTEKELPLFYRVKMYWKEIAAGIVAALIGIYVATRK